jgi:acetyl-CoA synthetase
VSDHSSSPELSDDVVWRPTPEVVAQSNLLRFMKAFGARDLADLHERSTADLEGFWRAVFQDLDIQFYEPYTRLIDTTRGIQWPRWCAGGRLNIVHNCVDKRRHDPRLAIRWEGEDGSSCELTYQQLADEVNRAVNALRRLGVKKGDVVALFLPMLPETAIALFTVAKLGGIVLPLFSGYGAEAVATRLAHSGATCLITCDAFRRHGHIISTKTIADAALERCVSVRHVVVVRRSGIDVQWTSPRDRWWSDLVDHESSRCDAEPTLAEDPLMLIYTSGTTGRPKATVHTHCGFPVKAAQDLSQVFDLKPRDTIFWITDLGWMMGPWELFGATLIGSTILLYEGAPDYPRPARLWELVDRHRVTVLGVSPTLTRMLMSQDHAPVVDNDSTLRVLGSTGEPWDEKSWRWCFEHLGGSRLPLINYSGGTEVSGGILGGNVLSPLKPCAFAGPVPGIAADVVDEHGNSIRERTGELVIRQPWIGMTRGFWKDPDRYVETYWSKIPGVWVHGDWARVDHDGSWYVLGRSDDTIKVAGKRIAPAEIESVLSRHPAVASAAAIGVPDPMRGQSIVCFCVKRPESDVEQQALSDLVVEALGRSARPRAIRFVGDLPRTRNGKVMRRLVRAAFLGEDVGDTSALENPDALRAIRDLGLAPDN